MRHIAITFIVHFLVTTLFAQSYKLNYGLKEPQPKATLPVSKGAIQKAERKNKVATTTQLIKGLDNEFIISGGWEMSAAKDVNKEGNEISDKINTSAWYNATVPGTVLTTLVDQGVYPDPYYGLNNLSIPDTLCRMDWWYRTSFPKPKNSSDKKVRLLFNGINYEANIWFNGTLLGSMKGAFIRGEFEITELLKEINHLAVHILPPPNPGIPHEQSAIWPKGHNGGQLCKDGPTFVCSEGWDWMPGIRDRNIGIWQDVRLKIGGSAKIIDPQIVTDLPLPDTTKADISVKTAIDCSAEGEYSLELSFAGNKFSKKLQLNKGTNTIALSSDDNKKLQLKDPKLWWPNGYGAPNLYTMKMVLKDSNSEIVDIKTIRFGVREISYDFAVATQKDKVQRINFNPTEVSKTTTKVLFDNLNHKEVEPNITVPTLMDDADMDLFTKLDGNNPYLTIKVNGQAIFCKGGNWGMDDAMKRVSRERLEPSFKLHKEAHYNMIRNWTAESTEEVFFELADEYGMLIWNDFGLSTQNYNLLPDDFDLWMTNVVDIVKRYRNHPSIVLWCARNEGYAPEEVEKRLATLVATEDGTRHYQSNSRKLNLRNSGPWNFFQSNMVYFKKLADGFSTEVGTLSIPTAESMRKMMPEEDVWPISDNWYYHDLHTGHEQYRSTLIKNYSEPTSLEDFTKKAQLLNYNSHRAIFEAWNSKLWENASGILLWMTHPAWPSMIWQTYSWDFETYGAYYGSKKACEPLHVQLNQHDNKVLVINTSLKAYANLTVKASLLDENGKILHEQDSKVEIDVNSKEECFVFSIPQGIVLPEYTFTKLTLTDKDGKLLSDNLYWDSRQKSWNKMFYGFNELKNVELQSEGSFEEKNGKIIGKVTIKNPSDVVALTLKLNLRCSETGKAVLPTYFSDGYFSLFPGEERVVTFECDKNIAPSNYYISAEGYNVERKEVLSR
ncbi:glycoside hydrolase family 2 [Labilibacter sediminis]|nr:glycoside hydrolase family 2 [Labilibacter sediminis]